MIMFEAIQIAITTTVSTHNLQVSVPKSVRATYSVRASSVPTSKKSLAVSAPMSEYTLTPHNFRNMVMQGKRFES